MKAETATLRKDHSKYFDSTFARISNYSSYILSVGIVWMFISGSNPQAISLIPLVAILNRIAQTSIAHDVGRDKPSPVDKSEGER